MKRILEIGIGLVVALCASTAMASEDQLSGTFQTLGNVAAEETAVTAMSDSQLDAVEGKRFRVVVPWYYGQYGTKSYHNHSNVTQSNGCMFCGNANGGLNGLFRGGAPNSGVIQSNGNTTSQYIR